MKRKYKILVFPLLFFICLSCQDQKNPVQPNTDDADEIVYSIDIDQMYHMNVNSKTQTRIPVVGGSPIASPDGRYLAFYSWTRKNGKSAMTMNISDLDGSDERQLATVAEGDSIFIVQTSAWSPDSKKIAYAAPKQGRDHDVYLFDLEKSREIKLSVDGGVDPRFSPDGQLVTYHTLPPSGISKSYIVNSDGSGHRAFLPNEPTLQPHWSPDMQKIYYTYYRAPGPNLDADVFVVDADETNPRQLTFDGVSVVSVLSNDGKYLLYISVVDIFGVWNFQILNLESGTTSKITDGLRPAKACWSPNDNMIAFAAAVPGDKPTIWLWRKYNNSVENLGIPSHSSFSWIPKIAN